MYSKCYICCNGEIIRYGLSLVQLRLKYGCWHLFLSGTDKVALIWTVGQLEQNTVCRDRLGLVIEVAGTMYSKRYTVYAVMVRFSDTVRVWSSSG